MVHRLETLVRENDAAASKVGKSRNEPRPESAYKPPYYSAGRNSEMVPVHLVQKPVIGYDAGKYAK